MRAVTIARNYADTLFELGSRAGDVEAWGELIDATAAAVSTDSIESVMMSPRVPREQKIQILSDALADAPPTFSLFMAAVVRRGRQPLIGTIADEYRILLDEKLGRVRAGITTARELDTKARDEIVERLSAAIGKSVIAGFAIDPEILGGTVIRVGDRIYDGSIRRRLGRLRRQLLAG